MDPQDDEELETIWSECTSSAEVAKLPQNGAAGSPLPTFSKQRSRTSFEPEDKKASKYGAAFQLSSLKNKLEGRSDSNLPCAPSSNGNSGIPDDVEEEIAKIRYRSLTTQESAEWLERERVMRPTRPVLEPQPMDVETEIGKMTLADSAVKFVNHPITQYKQSLSLSVPVLSVRKWDSTPNFATDFAPDRTKASQIKSASSAFSSPTRRNKVRKLRKAPMSLSLDSLLAAKKQEEERQRQLAEKSDNSP